MAQGDSNNLEITLDVQKYENGVAYRECPHCKETKPIEDFGLRKMGDGTIRIQSWCKACR